VIVFEASNSFRDWKPIRNEVIALTKTGKRTQAFAITLEKEKEDLNGKL